jgi:hypothetical protein
MSERRVGSSARVSPERLAVRDAHSRFPGQWVLLKVTEFDEFRTPLAGEVVTHGTRRHVNKTLVAFAASGGRLKEPHYLFHSDAHRPADDATDSLDQVLAWWGLVDRSGR